MITVSCRRWAAASDGTSEGKTNKEKEKGGEIKKKER